MKRCDPDFYIAQYPIQTFFPCKIPVHFALDMRVDSESDKQKCLAMTEFYGDRGFLNAKINDEFL